MFHKLFIMKKFFLLLFCFISSLAFSQEYHFDYKCYGIETQLKARYKGNERTNIIYFNSQNKDILAYDYSFSHELTRIVWLYDYVNNYFFSFTINQKSEFSSLNLRNSFPIKIYSDEIKVERVDVEEVSENIWIIKAFPSQKSKKSNLELKVVLKKSDFPMPRIRFMDLSPNIHNKIYDALFLKLNSLNYRIVDVVYDYKNGVIMHEDFSKCEKINLKILTKEKSRQEVKK